MLTLITVPEVYEHIDIQNITKKSENSKSGGASVSRFADILQTTSGHTKKGNLKLKKTERGKFTIAKGSPVSAKKKSSKESSGLTVPNIVRFPTNQKAANIGNFTHSNLVTNRNESVGQITPSKRKLMGGEGRGDVRSLVCIFENGFTKPTWDDTGVSESPAKRQRCGRGSK